jgi:hypothetical protein
VGSRTIRQFALMALACASALTVSCRVPEGAAHAQGANDPGIRRDSERKRFTDEQIAEGFMKITFGAEMRAEPRADRIRKFDVPVRLFVDSQAEPDRRSQIVDIVADIGKRIRNLDIAITPSRAEANVVVTLVHDRDLDSKIRSVYGRERARKIQHSLEPQCLAGITHDERYRIQHSEVLLVVDAGDFVFYDCAYEEILQALGPINDDNSVPWTMFNDDVSMGFFDVYDQILLNLLYDPRLRPGMTQREIRDLLPKILPEVRTFVASNNGLPH